MGSAKLYTRESYLRKLRPFYHVSDIIKVVTGIRRCGKTSLMLSVMQELREEGVDSGHLVHIDLDGCLAQMLMCGKVSQEDFVELTADPLFRINFFSSSTLFPMMLCCFT